MKKMAARDFEDLLQVGFRLSRNDTSALTLFIVSVLYLVLRHCYLRLMIGTSGNFFTGLQSGMRLRNFACTVTALSNFLVVLPMKSGTYFATSMTILVHVSQLRSSLEKLRHDNDAKVPIDNQHQPQDPRSL